MTFDWSNLVNLNKNGKVKSRLTQLCHCHMSVSTSPQIYEIVVYKSSTKMQSTENKCN